MACRKRLRPEQRRQLILDSALNAFSERGYHAASVGEIARGAGTTKAVIYDHVASKRELYDAVVRRELESLLEVTAGAGAQAGGGQESLRAILEAFFGHIESRPQARRVLFETVDASEDIGIDQRATQMTATAAIAARLAAEANLLCGQPDREIKLEMVAQMLKSTMNGLADWWYDHPEVPRAQIVDAAAEFLLSALSAFVDSPPG